MPYDVLSERFCLRGIATIISGGTQSDGLSMGGRPILGLIVPIMNGTGPTVKAQISDDGANWYDVFNEDGATVSVDITAGVAAFAVNSEDLSPLAGYVSPDVWIRLVASAAQTAEREFTWLTVA